MRAKTIYASLTALHLAVTFAFVSVILCLIPFSQAQTLTTLYSFRGAPDGEGPTSAVLLDAAGNLYGTTYYGGNSKACPTGCGTIYKIDPTGNETVLHDFNQVDGRNPYAGLIMDDSGNFYGTTNGGGTFDYGTLFKCDSGEVLTVLWSFNVNSSGTPPMGSLLRDPAGNLYGTVAFGGPENAGAVFKWEIKYNSLRILHSFTRSPDGYGPSAALIRDDAGHFYGTTQSGGTDNAGTVFRLDKTGLTILHSFTVGPDAEPLSSLVGDSQGNLYGTTHGRWALTGCAAHGGCGTVFKLDAAENETVLHTFSRGPDGSIPQAGLVSDPAGNLYGTTIRGGDFDRGTIFRI